MRSSRRLTLGADTHSLVPMGEIPHGELIQCGANGSIKKQHYQMALIQIPLSLNRRPQRGYPNIRRNGEHRTDSALRVRVRWIEQSHQVSAEI